MPDTGSLDEVRRFFFEAISKGWASGNNGAPIRPENVHEGWREIGYNDHAAFPGYSLIDQWGKDVVSGKPAGSTFIHYHGVPVWAMWYGKESYEKKALPFLQKALLFNYDRRLFVGGRGPRLFDIGAGLKYVNKPKGTFAQFEGEEYIEDLSTGVRLGSHKYWGRSLRYS